MRAGYNVVPHHQRTQVATLPTYAEAVEHAQRYLVLGPVHILHGAQAVATIWRDGTIERHDAANA